MCPCIKSLILLRKLSSPQRFRGFMRHANGDIGVALMKVQKLIVPNKVELDLGMRVGELCNGFGQVSCQKQRHERGPPDPFP